MITTVVAFVLVSLSSGIPVKEFRSLDECLYQSYRVSLVTGQETRCQPVYRVIR